MEPSLSFEPITAKREGTISDEDNRTFGSAAGRVANWSEYPDADFSAEGATQLCIFEQWIAPAADVRTHNHPVEEVLTVIEGEAEMWIDEKRSVVTAGQSLLIPAHRKHGFRNIGSETLHIHAVLASAIFEAMFESGIVRRWEN